MAADEITIQGKAPSWQACDKLLAMLTESGYSVDMDRRGTREDEWIQFTIK